jgi:aminoglycoside N3'-acetyltransferase
MGFGGLRSSGSYDAMATRWANVALHKAIEAGRGKRHVGRVPRSRFRKALDGYDHDTVFAHVGLGDVNRALEGDPYEQVVSGLKSSFDSVLAPGFTDYFATSGVYDKQHSRPKHGSFGKQFLRDADYRTDDACRSILVKGEYRFDGCDHRDTFAPDGCFERLREDDVLVVSVGTPWLVCSYLHHLEAKHGVPYVSPRTMDGVMHDDGTCEQISQTTHIEDGMWFFNKVRLHRLLRRHGALDEYDLNGLRVFAASVRDVDRLVGPQFEADPYYLVSL